MHGSTASALSLLRICCQYADQTICNFTEIPVEVNGPQVSSLNEKELR